MFGLLPLALGISMAFSGLEFAYIRQSRFGYVMVLVGLSLAGFGLYILVPFLREFAAATNGIGTM